MRISAFLLSSCARLLLAFLPATLVATTVDEDFLNPPRAARPYAWWQWMGSNVTAEGIERDVAAMGEAGIGGAVIFSNTAQCGPWAGLTNAANPSLRYRNDEYWRLFKVAADAAKRAGIRLAFHNCPGYSASGGDWIKPENGMKKIVWTSAPKGGTPVQPERVLGFYRDIATVEAEGKTYRFGYTCTGAKCVPVPEEIWDTALEADKMSERAMKVHMDAVLLPFVEHLGSHVGTTFEAVFMDSYEAGESNWTDDFREEFTKRRGYDPVPLLPVLAGALKDKAETFKADLKRTVEELYRDRHYKYIAKRCHDVGLQFWLEPYGGPFDEYEAALESDLPMDEFWLFRYDFTDESYGCQVKPTIWKAVLDSKRAIFGAEAFTDKPAHSRWQNAPRHFRRTGDITFARGYNRLFLQAWPQQPFSAKWKPGMTFGFWGTHMGVNQTWFEPGKEWIRYLGRCQAVMQRGLPIADGGVTSSSPDVIGCGRREGEAAYFFVANRTQHPAAATLTFDAIGAVEIWDPETKERFAADGASVQGGKTTLPLALLAEKSKIVVIRPKSSAQSAPKLAKFAQYDLGETWLVSFEKDRGAPEGVCVVEGLKSLSTFEDPRIRYFSGTATYVKRTQFFFDKEDNLAQAKRVVLDLGDVREIAEVTVNGRNCGIVWHPPFRVDITGTLHKGENNFVEVKVTNTWRNRLIGDKREPDDCDWWVTHEERAPHTGALMYAGRGIRAIPEFVLKDGDRPSKGRVCFTTWDYLADNTPLLEAGLLGPVKVELLGACGAEKSRVISVAEFRDRMQGAWIGQSVGVSYGWPTEFKGKGTLIDEAKMPVWKPETINETFNQDDLYVEMTFLKTLLEKGVGVTSREAGIDFANSAYRLWCANNNARNNLRRGIAAPASSHPDFHRTTDDIDYQIEADFSGILAPGLPQAAVDLGETFGRIMNYGDGLYAGQFVGAMYAEAYFCKDPVEVVKRALKAIPAESKYAGMVRDMFAWHAADPKDWKGAWKQAVDKYQATNLLGKVSFPAIDVKINGAMALLGLLYGEGDMMKTAYISTRGGYDSDCNPSSACGVLGTMIGLKAMDPKFHSALDRTKKWEFTDFTWDGLVAASERVTRQLVIKYGGKIEKDASGAEVFTLPVRAVRPSVFFDSKKPGPIPAEVRLTPAERARIRYLPCEKEGVQSVCR